MAPATRRLAAVLLILLPAAAAGLLAWRPPDLVRLGAAYAAKTVCSGVFVAGRDGQEVLRDDVMPSGPAVLRLFSLSVDREARRVRVALLGVFAATSAVARDGTGCAVVPDGDLARARAHRSAPLRGTATGRAPWPEGDDVGPAVPELTALLRDPLLGGPGLRAAVVVHRGRIVAEHYGRGFGSDTPLAGWSMAKTVNAALVGTVLAAGRLDPARRPLFAEWARDARREIGLADLMAMADGLDFDERYVGVTDVTRMLYLEPDTAAFARSRAAAHPPGQRFNYASGSSVLLARLWQDAVGEAALQWPRDALFAPLGMRRAVLEADARGTFVGSSHLYASARDWARFALLLLNDGRWNEQALLPPGWVPRMFAPSAAAPDAYTQGQMWVQGPTGGTAAALPADTRWMRGFDGQSIALVPSRGLAVVRLGLTPAGTPWQPQPLVAAVLRALPPP